MTPPTLPSSPINTTMSVSLIDATLRCLIGPKNSQIMETSVEILFRREQTSSQLASVTFKLWCQIELSEDEQGIVKRYQFDQSVLIEEDQPKLLRQAAMLGLAVFVVLSAVLFSWSWAGPLVALIAGGGTGYWYYHQKRETIFVSDLIHGRIFTCASVIELAQKEARLHDLVGMLRQVMESAKHWDGTEKHMIEALPREEAKRLIGGLA